MINNINNNMKSDDNNMIVSFSEFVATSSYSKKFTLLYDIKLMINTIYLSHKSNLKKIVEFLLPIVSRRDNKSPSVQVDRSM